MLRHSFYLIVIFCGFLSHAQTTPETVFITEGDPNEKPAKEKPFFGQFSISIPLRGNPYRDDNTAYIDADQNGVNDYSNSKTKALNFIIPDGLTANIGYGVHLKKWIGLTANTGIEYSGHDKLVLAPVFGSVVFNPQIWEETNVYLQYGYGYAFALGRGDLGGRYQKYRFGILKDNEVSLYLEANLYDFPLHEYDRIGTLCIGIAFFDFL